MTCFTISIDPVPKEPKESRLRCIGHVINLVVKAFLYGHAFVEQTGVESEEDALLEASLSTWRKRGPYGKLRNVIAYICTVLVDIMEQAF